MLHCGLPLMRCDLTCGLLSCGMMVVFGSYIDVVV
jgi:hypothetical protein